MVIGSGMLARAFSSYAPVAETLIFASGVSNSKETRADQFEREEELVRKTLAASPGKLFVYFSTTSVYDEEMKGLPYVRHKMKIEERITDSGGDFLLCRVSNVVGPSCNRATVINYFFDKVVRGERFELWRRTFRNIIDVADVFRIVDYIVQQNLFRNRVVNVASPVNTPVEEIIRILEEITGKQALFTPLEKGGRYDIDTSMIEDVVRVLGIGFDREYVKKTISRYCWG